MRTKLSLILGGLVLVSLGLTATAVGHWFEANVMQLQAKRLHGEATRMATALDIGLYERLREVTNLAASVKTPPVAGLRREDIDRLQKTYPNYAWIGLTDAEGRVVTASGGTLEGDNVASRGWWKSGRIKPTVLDVHDALLLKRYIAPPADGGPPRLLDVSAPIVIDGATVGVLGAHLNWAWAGELYSRMVESSGTGDDGIELLIFNREGRNLRLLPGDEAGPEALPRELAKGSPYVVVWPDGRPYLTAVVARAGYGTYEGLGWSVVVRQPEAVVAAPAQTLMRRAWLFSAAAGVLLMLGIWVAVGKLLQPLRKAALQAEASVVATGDGDEVRQLSTALSELVAQLRAREAELLALNEGLDGKVAARTAELERRNAELAALTRVIAHDIKAPVLTVAQFLQLSRGGDAASVDRACGAAITECQHVGRVVDALQGLMSSDQRPIKGERIDMAALAREAGRRQQLATHFAGEFTVEDLPPAWGDPVLIGEVWENLIGNAMKYAGRSPKPAVVVSARRDGAATVYEVVDNGIGFEPQQAGQLFQAFSRLVTDVPFRGTGLGLTIVKRIVERHGGQVGARGRPGEGATFFFSLTQSAEVPPAGPASASPSEPRAEEQSLAHPSL